jgi:hypothetical protein
VPGLVGNLPELAFFLKKYLTSMANIDIIVNARGALEPTEAILVADEMKGEGNRWHVRTESFFGWVKQGPGQMARALLV